MRTWFTVDVLGDAKLCAKVDGDSFNNTADDFQVFLECFSFRHPFFLSLYHSIVLFAGSILMSSLHLSSFDILYIYVDNNSRILVLLIVFEFEQSFDSCKSIPIIKLNCNR